MMKRLLQPLLPDPIWSTLRRIKAARDRGLQRALDRLGLVVARKHDYYSPLPAVSSLARTRDRWDRPSRLRGLTYDLEGMKAELSRLLSRYLDEFTALPDYDTLHRRGFGQGYTAVDALTLYLMIRDLKPRRYLEVGSGLSTCYCALAAERNAREGHPLDLTCVEPHPFEALRTIPGVRLIPREVQDVELSHFEALEAGDVLFIDSSHALRIDSDVPFLYLEVLPALKPGVVVQIHDIPFPYNVPYPPRLWVFGQTWPTLWNEPMVLQAFLCFNERFRITLSTPLLRHFDEPFLRASIPGYESAQQNPYTFSSIWLTRVS